MSDEEQTYYEERHRMEHNLQKMEEMLQAYNEQARTAAALEEEYPTDPERIKESKSAAVMAQHAQALVDSAKADLEKLKSSRVSSPEPSTPTVKATGSYAALEPSTKGGETMSKRIRGWIINLFAIIGFIVILSWLAFVWPGPQVQNWWQTDIEPNLPCFMVEEGGTCGATPEAESGNTEPDFGEPIGLKQWEGSYNVCDQETYLGRMPDGSPAFGYCVDPPA